MEVRLLATATLLLITPSYNENGRDFRMADRRNIDRNFVGEVLEVKGVVLV